MHTCDVMRAERVRGDVCENRQNEAQQRVDDVRNLELSMAAACCMIPRVIG
jgi:hypothetical protein